MDDHVLLLAAQGAQKKIRTAPPPRIKASIAKIVHTVEKGVTRVDSNLLAAGKSTISSVLKPDLLALPSKNLRRLDAFSQDISFYFACTFIKISIYRVPFVFIIVFSMLKKFEIYPSKNNLYYSSIWNDGFLKIHTRILRRFLFKG